MKKTFMTLMMAVALAVSAACSNGLSHTFEYRFNIREIEQKAVLDEARVVWEDGDMISVFSSPVSGSATVGFDGGSPYADMCSDREIPSGTMICAAYPSVDGADPAAMPFSIPAEQNASVCAMPLAAIPATMEDGTADLYFVNLAAIVEFRVYSTNTSYCGEKILSIALTADEPIAGEGSLDLTEVSLSDPRSLQLGAMSENTVTVTRTADIQTGKDEADPVMMVVAPADVNSCDILVTTDQAEYRFRFSPERGFVRSVVKTINIDLKNGIRNGGSDIPVTPPAEPDVEPVTATLAYSEFEGNAAAYVAGYGKSKAYTNASGTWTICAYNTGSAIQINSGKIAFVGTPRFDHDITSLTIETSGTYTDDYHICTDAGSSTSAVGVKRTVRGTASSTTIDVSDLELKQVYIRSGACARITAITVNVGTSGASEDDPESGTGEVEEGGDTPGPGSDPDQPVTPDHPITTAGGWYELPVINDADHNGIDDNDANLYYASHSFSLNGKKVRNYTVCFSKEHHCPVWVAAPRHSCYVGSQNRTNAYTQDPKIQSLASGIQYFSKDTGGECNKGHMLGSAERTCNGEANRQVFYYSNIAPQLSAGFNTGGGGWNLLEDYIDTRVPADTLYEVIGCYFDTYTDAYGHKVSPKKIEFGARSDVGFPTMFYYAVIRTKSGKSGKALKDCSASEIQCVAFVRSHTNSLKGVKPSARELMSISDLEKITGFTYFPNVPNAPKSSFNASDWGL